MVTSDDSGESVVEQPASTKPYLIRAIHEWSLDNGFTPQILVATDNEQVSVPWEHVKDNRIVLNIHPQSVKHLELGNEFIMCSARFSGRPFEITVPVYSVQAIYAKENGQGVVFQEEENTPPIGAPPLGTDTSEVTANPQKPGNHGGSHLKLVK
jgi:stringent starvation protein B